MKLTDESRQKFGEALANGINAILGRGQGRAWLTPSQYRRGYVQITESFAGGASAASIFAKKVEALSPAITRCSSNPISFGSDTVYSVGIEFDTSIAEALYSDGKNAVRTFEKDGKKYVVDDSGAAVEVTDPDKYVKTLNQSTGSNLRKVEDLDPLEELKTLVDDAKLALEDIGVDVSLDGDKIVITGDAALVKPTQKALPDPFYGLEDLDGGYNAETGAVEVVIPKFADTRDVTNLRDFLIKAVNIILDIHDQGMYTPEDEWSQALDDADVDPVFASRYAYSGESFVGDDKAKGAVLIKSLAASDFNEAKKVADKLMGDKIAEALMIKIKPKVTESKEAETKKPIILDEESILLDSLHESYLEERAKACSVDTAV